MATELVTLPPIAIKVSQPPQQNHPLHNTDHHVIDIAVSETDSHACDTTCVICLDDIEENDESTLQCDHVFHRECLARYIVYNGFCRFIVCPMCRQYTIQDSSNYLTSNQVEALTESRMHQLSTAPETTTQSRSNMQTAQAATPETAFRRAFRYPPFKDMVTITLILGMLVLGSYLLFFIISVSTK